MAKRAITSDEELEGLSLSLCIRDIFRGCVQESQVTQIISPAKARDREAFESLLEHYAEIYWLVPYDDPEECKAIAERLYNSGKILFKDRPVRSVADGQWRVAGQGEQFDILCK